MSKNIVQTKSYAFALEVLKLTKELKYNKEFLLADQFFRSGTSVGANVREAKNAESRKDFIHKLSIAQKECDETIYWIELIRANNSISDEKYLNLKSQATEILKILKSIILSTKQNQRRNS